MNFTTTLIGPNELSYLNHINAREMTNGMWFLASLFLMFSLVKFLVPNIYRHPRIWRWGIDVKLAWGIFLIAFGTALRAGWIWALLIANALQNEQAVRAIEDSWVVSYFAIGCGIWGAVCSVKAITEAANAQASNLYLWGYWLFVVAATITIPVIVNSLI